MRPCVYIAETRARQVCGAWVLVYRGYLGLHSVGFRSLFIRGKSWRRFPVPNSHSWRYIHCNVYKLFMISRSQINRRPFTPRHYNNKDRMQHVTELGILILKTFWKILTPNININHRHLTLYIFYHDLKNMYPLYLIIHYVNLLRLRKRTF